jgi:hypothetical protein
VLAGRYRIIGLLGRGGMGVNDDVDRMRRAFAASGK